MKLNERGKKERKKKNTEKTGQAEFVAEKVKHACVSRCGLAVRRLAGKQKDLGSIRFGSPFS